MIIIQHTVLSDDIRDQHFVCQLTRCKGACCVEGDQGAPLEADEVATLAAIYPQVAPFLTEAGRAEIARAGTSVVEADGSLATPTIAGRECAYALYDDAGILKCGIEQAYHAGVIDYPKPISCHLYPIRVTRYDGFEALNYDRWDICAPACQNGKALGVPLYRFLQGPLTRRYGEDWYAELVREIEG
jgi:hypothetical protein